MDRGYKHSQPFNWQSLVFYRRRKRLARGKENSYRSARWCQGYLWTDREIHSTVCIRVLGILCQLSRTFVEHLTNNFYHGPIFLVSPDRFLKWFLVHSYLVASHPVPSWCQPNGISIRNMRNILQDELSF